MKLIMRIKRLVAFVLVLTMVFPSIALADDMNLMGDVNLAYENSPWLNLPIIEPAHGDSIVLSELELNHLDVLDYFLDMDTIPNDPGIPQNELTEASPEEIAEFLRGLEAEMQSPGINDTAEFSALMRQGQSFSQLTENNRALIFRQLNIAQESAETAGQLLTTMERDGFTLYDSVELLRIMATGLFNYSEAQAFFRQIPSSYIRRSELAQFEQFAQKFDISVEVNAQRLSGNAFFAVNEFGNNLDESVYGGARTAGDATGFFAHRNPYAQYSFMQAAGIAALFFIK